MSIKRSKRDTHYCTTSRSGQIDPRLSLRAKGLLWYLLGLPDDWEIYTSELTTHATDGLTATRSAIAELMDAGYITRSGRRRNNKGQLAEYDYIVYEDPKGIQKTKLHKMKGSRKSDRVRDVEGTTSVSPTQAYPTLVPPAQAKLTPVITDMTNNVLDKCTDISQSRVPYVYDRINLNALLNDPTLIMTDIAADVIDQVLSTDDDRKISIAGRQMPSRAVKAVYMRLTEHHVRRVLTNTAGQVKRSPSAYIRTALYIEVLEYDNKPLAQ